MSPTLFPLYFLSKEPVDDKTLFPDLAGGPLDCEYKVAQFHLHWGKTDVSGSEHRVNGHMYPAEVRLHSNLFSKTMSKTTLTN